MTRWIKRQRLDSGLRRCEVALRWEELVGARVAARSHPRDLRDGLLTVEVSSSAWLHELTFLRDELQRQIASKLGKGRVSALRFVPQRRSVRRTSQDASHERAVATQERRPSPGEIEAARHQAEREVCWLSDDELRDRIARARQAQLLREHKQPLTE